MATKDTKRTRKFRSKNSCFPSCFHFGYSVSDPTTKKSSTDVGSGKKKSPWFSWSSIRMRKSGCKTVPVDVAVVEKETRGVEAVQEIGKVVNGIPTKLTGKRQIRGTTDRKPSRDLGAVDRVAEQTVVDKSRKTKHGSGKVQRTESHTLIPTVQSRKPPDPKDTCPNTGSLRSKEGVRKNITRPGSPETKLGRSLTSSSSFPPNGRRKSTQIIPNSGQSDRKNGKIAWKMDPTVAISILIVTLAILLMWGRICAILCTAAWFYFIPRLRTEVNSGKVAENRPDLRNPDVNSSEYKKKVVLEGLLERNHRNPVAGAL